MSTGQHFGMVPLVLRRKDRPPATQASGHTGLRPLALLAALLPALHDLDRRSYLFSGLPYWTFLSPRPSCHSTAFLLNGELPSLLVLCGTRGTACRTGLPSVHGPLVVAKVASLSDTLTPAFSGYHKHLAPSGPVRVTRYSFP